MRRASFPELSSMFVELELSFLIPVNALRLICARATANGNIHQKNMSRKNQTRRLDAWPPGPARPPARLPAQPLGRPTAQPPGSPAARSPGRPAARLHGRQAVVRPPGRSAARPLIRLAARPPGRPAARPLGCTAARPSCGRPRPARPRIATQRFSPFLGSDPRTACSEPLRSVAARTATQ